MRASDHLRLVGWGAHAALASRRMQMWFPCHRAQTKTIAEHSTPTIRAPKAQAKSPGWLRFASQCSIFAASDAQSGNGARSGTPGPQNRQEIQQFSTWSSTLRRWTVSVLKHHNVYIYLVCLSVVVSTITFLAWINRCFRCFCFCLWCFWFFNRHQTVFSISIYYRDCFVYELQILNLKNCSCVLH